MFFFLVLTRRVLGASSSLAAFDKLIRYFVSNLCCKFSMHQNILQIIGFAEFNFRIQYHPFYFSESGSVTLFFLHSVKYLCFTLMHSSAKNLRFLNCIKAASVHLLRVYACADHKLQWKCVDSYGGKELLRHSQWPPPWSSVSNNCHRFPEDLWNTWDALCWPVWSRYWCTDYVSHYVVIIRVTSFLWCSQ